MPHSGSGSGSRGFVYCLPVRTGALVVSAFLFAGSLSLTTVTLRSFVWLSSHVTSSQAGAYSITSISWLLLMLFSLLGFIGIVLEHPLLITVFTRFLLFHSPINFLFNIIFIAVFLHSFAETKDILHAFLCNSTPVDRDVCNAFGFMQRVTWLYVFILLPAGIAQLYAYNIFKRFVPLVNDDGVMQTESHDPTTSQTQDTMQRQLTIKRPVSRGGRRKAKALWFTNETPTGAGDSFLPSMILSPPKPSAHPWSSPHYPPMPEREGITTPPIRTPVDLENMLPQKKAVVPKASFTSTGRDESSSGSVTHGSKTSQDLSPADFLEMGSYARGSPLGRLAKSAASSATNISKGSKAAGKRGSTETDVTFFV